MKLVDGTRMYVALVVSDLERAAAFYRDVLGMTEVKRVVVSDDKAARSGSADKGFEFWTFTLGPLALKLVKVATEPQSTVGGVDSHTGVRYLSFVVEDIDATCEELEAKGVSFLSPVLDAEAEHDIDRLVFFRDPDGNLLELYGK